MLKSLIVMVLSAILMIGGAARATAATTKNDVWDRGCGDDDGNDRCAANTQSMMRAAYRVDDAESLMRAGVVLRRAMIVDGYGNDLIAITFQRKPGSAPQVDLRVPCDKRQACHAPLTAHVPIAIWNRVLRQSDDFDQELVRETDIAEGERTICIHAWLAVVEAVDPARNEVKTSRPELNSGTVRSDTESACADGLAVPFAFEIAELALQSLPECAALQPQAFRNTPTLLATCTRLGGDRIAASEAFALLNQITDRTLNSSAVEQLFGFDNKQRAMQFMTDAEGGLLTFGPPTAADQDNASARGKLHFDEANQEADVTATLVRRFGSFTFAAIKIGQRRKRNTSLD